MAKSTAVMAGGSPSGLGTSAIRFTSPSRRLAFPALVGICAALAAAVAPIAAGATASVASWPFPNGDLANTRDAVSSVITSKNAHELTEAWSFKLSGKAAQSLDHYGSLATNPIIVGGVVYLQDLYCNVYALSLATGALKWEYKVDKPERSGPGPNGVAVASGMVYGLSPDTAFALDARTGRQIWRKSGLLGPGQGTFGIQPQVADGRVYVPSQYGASSGGGVLMALSASSGALLWRFNTVLQPDLGVKAVGLGSGGAWETPLVEPNGSVTYGIGNPYQSAASAITHPRRQLYTDSDVNLDSATGRLRWYYQAVANDFMNWDMQTSPIGATVGTGPVVIGSGKMGYVYEMSATTGKLLWKTPVGRHNGNDNDGLLALEHKSTLKAPFTIWPGSLGGVLTNLALAGDTIYVATNDFALTSATLKAVTGTVPASRLTGEVEALNLATGRVMWDTKVPSLPLGAVTVSNDLVFTTLFTGELLAFDRQTGAIVYRMRLPTSTNSPLAVAGNTIVIPAGAMTTQAHGKPGRPQVVAYRLR